MGRTKKIVDKSVVLEASLDLIESEGIEAFSTRRLAARLRISAMTLYNYYENREAILREVALRGLSDFLASLAAELGRHPEVGRAPLLAYKLLAAEFMRLGKERPRLYLFLFDSGLEELRRDPEVAKYYGHLLEGIRARVRRPEALAGIEEDVYLFQVLVNGLVIGSIQGRSVLDAERYGALVARAYERLLSPHEAELEA